jgi:hypothetical protein
MRGDDDTLTRNDLAQVLDTLVAMRSDLSKTLKDGESIPDIVKMRMEWADSELDCSIRALKLFLRGPGSPL